MRHKSFQDRVSTFATDPRATSAVEFALIAPVFLLLMLGMIGYGIYFGASNSVQQIAADAARTAIAGIDQSERQTLANLYIQRNAAGYAFIDPQNLAVDVRDSQNDANQFVVAVSYDAKHLPIWSLFPKLTMPGSTIRRSSTIRIGGI